MKKAVIAVFCLVGIAAQDPVLEVRSARSGAWSDSKTWEGDKVPGSAMRIRIRPGHRVVYDVRSDEVFRSILIGGVLTFAPDRDTRLNVGLINVQPGESSAETGFDCDAHLPEAKPGESRALLEVGSPERPVDAGRTATIRLHLIPGMDPASFPAIVCCGGGRMDFQGTPMNRTWVKLGKPATAGDREITLDEAVSGWAPGDRVIVTSTCRQNKIKKTFKESVREGTETEERIVKAVDGSRVTLESPLDFGHIADRQYRGEVANLSRNVVVESADPSVSRGHTMYHRDAAGSIGYAEFRHLGKEGVLGRYSLHFHRAGESMRGASVVGASIWDSGNRWITIHGTNYLVVRDCVGYRSKGHGFFMEDGTEVFNVLDRNLAVQAFIAKPLPKQVLPYDKNDGSGFWWGNCQNTFTRNVACDCDEYGYFFQSTKTPDFDPRLPVEQADGTRREVDVRTLPFIRFEDNESHTQRRHAFNLGGGVPFGEPTVGGVGPDLRHPFVIRNMKAWDVHWAFHPVSPSVLVDRMDIFNAEYAIWRPVYKNHAYHEIGMDQVTVHKEFSPVGTKPEEAAFPKPLDPVDDQPPITVVTFALRRADGTVFVRGTTSDGGPVKRVVVNGFEAKATRQNFAEWEVVLGASPKGELKLVAHAEDEAGNVESHAHELFLR
jgi:hypothetical protein